MRCGRSSCGSTGAWQYVRRLLRKLASTAAIIDANCTGSLMARAPPPAGVQRAVLPPLGAQGGHRRCNLRREVLPVALDRDAPVVAAAPQRREIGAEVLPMPPWRGAFP